MITYNDFFKESKTIIIILVFSVFYKYIHKVKLWEILF